jgi:hypothetical protein
MALLLCHDKQNSQSDIKFVAEWNINSPVINSKYETM